MSSYAKNDIAELLYHKVTTKALKGEPFSVVIVFPLATEESETQYPNLRTAQCMYESLTKFWDENHITTPLSDYFGMYTLGNVVRIPEENDFSAFYGIFVHSKL